MTKRINSHHKRISSWRNLKRKEKDNRIVIESKQFTKRELNGVPRELSLLKMEKTDYKSRKIMKRKTQTTKNQKDFKKF